MVLDFIMFFQIQTLNIYYLSSFSELISLPSILMQLELVFIKSILSLFLIVDLFTVPEFNVNFNFISNFIKFFNTVNTVFVNFYFYLNAQFFNFNLNYLLNYLFNFNFFLNYFETIFFFNTKVFNSSLDIALLLPTYSHIFEKNYSLLVNLPQYTIISKFTYANINAYNLNNLIFWKILFYFLNFILFFKFYFINKNITLKTTNKISFNFFKIKVPKYNVLKKYYNLNKTLKYNNFKEINNPTAWFQFVKKNILIFVIILFLVFNKLSWLYFDMHLGFTNYFYKIYDINSFKFLIQSTYGIFPIFIPTKASILLHVIVVYWIYTWLVLNWKRAQFGRFPRKMKKLWFKVLTMIWMAEILLFLTFFTCAILIVQSPTAYFIEYKNVKSLQLSYVWVFTRMWKLAAILWVCNFMRTNLRWFDWKKIVLLSFAVTLYILKLGFHDWYFLTHHAGWCKQTRLFIKGKCDVHYRFILIVFRIVHTYLIAAGWLFFIYRSIDKKKIRYTMLTANIQNLFYLTLLTYVMQLYLIRDSLFDIYYSPSVRYVDYTYNLQSNLNYFLDTFYIILTNLI